MSQFLGADIGSSYTKFAVVNDDAELLHHEVIPTLSRNRKVKEETLARIHSEFDIDLTCSSGYGRKHFESDMNKTELVCASVGVSHYYPFLKCVLDIGGEDIKVMVSGPEGEVQNFYMNDKCAAGTGTFIKEIAERAELDLAELNELARASSTNQPMNSFCTVFAKTEILTLLNEGISLPDLSRGIYLSVVKRIRKLPVKVELPLIACGGVAGHHPHLVEMMAAEFGKDVEVPPHPQFMVAFGAALVARKKFRRQLERGIRK